MITKLQAIISLVPGAEVTVYDNDRVEWIKPSEAPVTDEQIQVELERLQAEEPNKIAKANRHAAYVSEADPLFFKMQRGEATQEEWLAKIAEIKSRYPEAQA